MNDLRAARLQQSIQQCFQELRGQPAATISLAQYRAAFENLAELVEPVDNVSIEALSIGDMAAEWAIPAQAVPGRAILYFHSGTYVCGSLKVDRAAVARLAELSRTRALQFSYRLAPEHPFPAALEDGSAAYRWLLSQGYVPQQIGLVGSGAGGGLLVALLQTLRDQDMPLPVVGVCFSPLLDLTSASLQAKAGITSDIVLSPSMLEFAASHYCQPAELGHSLISPLYADLHGSPPLLLLVGQNELLHDDIYQLRARTRAQGVRVHGVTWADMCHGWQLFPSAFIAGERALDQVAAYCEKYFDLSKEQTVPG